MEASPWRDIPLYGVARGDMIYFSLLNDTPPEAVQSIIDLGKGVELVVVDPQARRTY